MYLSGTLGLTTNSAQKYNAAKWVGGTIHYRDEHRHNNVPAVRVVVTGLTNRLFNAVGTNSGNPFVYYSADLKAGQSVGLLLQYSADAIFR